LRIMRIFLYRANFYTIIPPGSEASARTLLPILWEFCKPTSLIDVGCGSGSWVRTAKELGATRAVGIDGNYVESSTLVIPAGDFVAHDLSQPLPHFERFDLALNLEVAEHLPEERADSLIADLCQLSDVVLFSAAIPGQGGVNHVNEQWPSYWVERFDRHGYTCIDLVRPQVWEDPTVEIWYRQNTFVALNRRRTELLERAASAQSMSPAMWDLAHPVMLEWVSARPPPPNVRAAGLMFAQAVQRSAMWRVRKLRQSDGL